MLPDNTHRQDLEKQYRQLAQKLIDNQISQAEFVSEMVQNHLNLEELADYDGLLPEFLNHSGFEKAVNRELSILRRRGDLKSTLLALDIDQLKRFNDALGHPAGDKLIKIYSQVMLKETRTADLKGRIGGDEFLVFLIGASAEDAKVVAEKIRQAIIEAVKAKFPELEWEQTISIGLTETTTEDNETDLRKRADQALYQAKQERNKVVTM